MKAVVLELKDSSAAVLGKDGCVYIVPDRGWQVGQTFELDPEEARKSTDRALRSGRFAGKRTGVFRFPRVLSGAAAAVVLLASVGSVTAYAMPCTTVTMDVNPSVSYELNVFDRVIGMEAYNDAGDRLSMQTQKSVKGKKITDAVSITLDALEDEEVMEEDSEVIITVKSRFRDGRKIEKKISDGVESWNEAGKGQGGPERKAEATIVEVPEDIREKAEEMNISPGRAYLIEQVRESLPEGSDFDPSDWKDRSVKELRDAAERPGELPGEPPAELPAEPPAELPAESSKAPEQALEQTSEQVSVPDSPADLPQAPEQASGQTVEAPAGLSQVSPQAPEQSEELQQPQNQAPEQTAQPPAGPPEVPGEAGEAPQTPDQALRQPGGQPVPPQR